MSQSGRKFQINPGPLKVVKRKALASQYELGQSVRCRALTKRGTRCQWTSLPGSDYCGVHGGKR